MGQTLTHGIYLPDEGERNCYNGLAANWQILDGSVGTIAAHTAALAGKANAVHTHTKSDITDFPAYGTTAGTICEGNDSRLSDARTPVAHTHGKADITDLFNSANEWTQINTYTTALRFSAANYSAGTPSSDIFYGSLQWGGIVNNSFVQSFGFNNAIRTTGINDISLRVWSQTSSTLRGVAVETNADASNSSFRPLVNNVTNLGSTVYQWNNIYSKNYYYNGVAWGLDKVNTWTANNSFYGITIYGNTTNTFQSNSSAGEKGDASVFALNIQVQDKNHAGWPSSGVANLGMGQDDNGSYISFGLDTKDSNNTRRNSSVSFLLKPTDNSNNAYFFPNRDNTVDLGISTNKWKTLNGVNPGALSLPDYDRFEPIDFSQWDVNLGFGNTYTPSEDGWLHGEIVDSATNSIYLYASGLQPVKNVYRKYGVSAQGNGSQNSSVGRLAVMMPVRKNVQYRFMIKASSVNEIFAIIFYPCLGNV